MRKRSIALLRCMPSGGAGKKQVPRFASE